MRLDPTALPTDVARFDTLAASSDTGDLETALALYRGDLLDGIDLITLEPDGYFLHERNRLRDLALRVAGTLVNAHDHSNNWEDVIRISRRGLMIDPFDEALHGHLVRALQKLGRHREARDQDDAFRHRMQTELGVPLPARPHHTPPRRAHVTPDPAIPAVPALPQPPPHRLWAVPVLAVLLALVVVAGLWRVGQGGPLAQGAPVSAAVKGLPSVSLEAYDLFLRAEDLRKAASDDTRLRAAIVVYRQATALDPDFSGAHAGLAMAAVAIAQRRFDAQQPPDASRSQAYDAAGQALQRDPENAHALIVLSRLQAQDGARDMALISAKRAVLSRPGDAEAHANLALLLSRSGQASAARTELSRLRQLDPMPRPDVMLIYGEIAFAEGRYDAAIADFVRAWPDLPQSPVLLTHLAAALAIQGQLAQSQVVLKDLRASWPKANLHQLYAHYAPIRLAAQNQRLLDGLRRAGLPVWSPGDNPATTDRLSSADLAALVGRVPGSERQYLRGEELCRIESGRSVCGAIFHAPVGRGVDYVFLAPTEIRFFSAPVK